MKYIKIFLKLLIIMILIIVLNYARIIVSYIFNKNEYMETFEIYGNKNGYAPQGLTYSEKYGIILQTAYNKNNNVSMLYVTDFQTGRLIKEIKLLRNDGSINFNHVGGITTDDNKVWITSDYEVNEFNLDAIVNTNDIYVKSLKDTKLCNRGDFCTYCDNTLWIGDFCLNVIYNVKDNDPLLMGYVLNEEINYNMPNYIISIPKMVQGMAITDNKEFIFTRSYSGLIKSELVIYENILSINTNNYYKLGGNNIKHFKLNNNNKIKTIKLPPMAEEFFIKDDSIFILFESSSDRYITAYPKINKIIKYGGKNVF